MVGFGSFVISMYTLNFVKNSSKNFDYALEFALELGGSFDGRVVTLPIPNDKLLIAYSTMRTIFGFVQKWKGTTADYNGLKVHPYQFILHAHNVYVCSLEKGTEHDCNLEDGSIGWGCRKIDIINYSEKGRGKNWFNYGNFEGYKWIIDKDRIKKRLVKYANDKALIICPFFDETKLLNSVDNLPDYIIPDNVTFEIVYAQRFAKGVRVQYPSNIKMVRELNRSPLITSYPL